MPLWWLPLTLAQLFQQNVISTFALNNQDAQQQITSYAVSKDKSHFLAAYYDADSRGTLQDQFHLVRFDTTAYRLTRQTLHAAEVHSTGPWDCFGSMLRIAEHYGTVAISTHINPSAGCVFVFSIALQFRTAVPGLYLAQSPQALLIESNVIHFAPTDPGSLSVLDLRTLQTTSIYPRANDPHRAAFLQQLRAHAPDPKWCRENNNPCDLEKFTTQFSNARYDAAKNAFVFDASLTTENMGPAAEASVPSRTDRYEYAMTRY